MAHLGLCFKIYVTGINLLGDNLGPLPLDLLGDLRLVLSPDIQGPPVVEGNSELKT